MKCFKLAIEVCITGIKKYGYAYQASDLTKQLKLIREPTNKHDRNAIKVMLDDQHIGYIKKDIAKIFSPILRDSQLKVKRWYVKTYTDGYILAHLYLR